MPDGYEFWRGYRASFWPSLQLAWTDIYPDTLKPRHRAIFHEESYFGGRDGSDLWHYRRILARENFSGGLLSSDITLVNWPQVDYWLGPLVGVEARGESKGAQPFRDSVGIGAYPIDLHPSSAGRNYVDVSSWPFQSPLGALILVRVENLLPACKNLGTTHVTNDCYRLHPVEWNVGEASGGTRRLLPGQSPDPEAGAPSSATPGRLPAFVGGRPRLRAYKDATVREL